MEIWQMLLLLAPLIILELVLMVVALVDLLKRERVRGNKIVWAVVILIFNLIGPIAYLIWGREEDTGSDGDY